MSLVIANLSVVFDEVPVLRNIDLSVGTRERFAIMGPSGAGKSTLLRSIAGLEPIETGSIVVLDKDVTRLPAHKRSVGLMFQDYALFPHLTVIENVVYGPRMAGVASAARLSRGQDLLELVGLGGFAERMPGTLSGGEQQRTALARTLAASPSVVLLDEPLGSLDESLKGSLLAETRAILEAVGATSLYVTHDPAEAFAFCDRMAILDGGKLVRTGTPAEIWSDPGSGFVARSIGHINVVPAEAIGVDGSGLCVVPQEAIHVYEKGDTFGTVQDVIFSDGWFDSAIHIEGSDVVLQVHMRTAPRKGERVAFDIDSEKTISVSLDEV